MKQKRITAYQLSYCALFCALSAVGAFIKVPIPYMPFTLQFLFTMLAGLILGPGLGAVSVLAYIFLGLIGLPIFTNGGGPGYILQPTFGYLMGFVFATYLTGYIAHRSSIRPLLKRLFIANFAGLLVVYFCGMVHFYFITNFYLQTPFGLWPLFLYCFILAVPGDIILCILSAVLVKRLRPSLYTISPVPVIKDQTK